MEQKNKTAHRQDIAIQTQNSTLNLTQIQHGTIQSKQDESLSKSKLKDKPEGEIIKEYEKKISFMSQTILKLTKKNQEQREQFRILNDKLNKAFSKLTPNKLKQSQEKSEQTLALTQELQKVKKELQNEMKRNKQLKKDLDLLKQTQNLLNDQDKITQLKNQLVQKQKEIKDLKEVIRVYERAEENEKKMTHFKKEEEMNKKLHQLNEENIFMKKKINEFKAKLQETEKQKAMEKAEQAIQKTLKPKKTSQSQQMVKKQIHDEEIKKLQQQVKILEGVKATLQKTHKQEVQALKKQNQILNEQVEELKFEIKRKNKEKFILQQRTQQMSQMKQSRLDKDRNSLTIDIDDKNQRYKTFSLNLKADSDLVSSNGLRKQFLGLSYGNFGNDYKKNDDSINLDESKAYTVSYLKFKYFEQHIVSLNVTYKYNTGQQIQLQTFAVDHHYSNLKTAQLTFQDHQYIKELDIYCGKMVEFISLKTSRNQILEVGNQKNQVKCKKYSFDIRSHEKPVAFGSITQLKKTGENTKKQCLVVFGLVIKRKDISINKKRLLLSSKDQSIDKTAFTQRPNHTKELKSTNQHKDELKNEHKEEKHIQNLTLKGKEKQKEKQPQKEKLNNSKNLQNQKPQKPKQNKPQKEKQKQKESPKVKQVQKSKKEQQKSKPLQTPSPQKSKSKIKK